jgi:phosphatidylserine/phosphatidylglycerophosphate/cardiolipin synthase-like enzyme
VIVEFIAGAKTRLDIAVQEIDSRAIAQAILDARWRGVRVQVFLEQDYLRSDLVGNPPKLPTPKAGESPAEALRRVQWLSDETDLAVNWEILAALLRSDIEVKGDYNPKILPPEVHPARLRRQSHCDLGAAVRLGQLHLDRHPHQPQQRVRVPQRVCLPPVPDRGRATQQGSFGRGLHGEVPKTYDLAGVPVRVLFAPDHTLELEIMKQLLKGSKECYFAIFTFAGSSGIDDAMLALARGGMKLKGALDPSQAAQDWAAPKWLKHQNIELFVPKREGAFAKLRKLHHKLMVIDERIVVAGSFNYTQPANEYNDENIFVMGSTHNEVEGIPVEAGASRQLAVYLKQEIQRIISLSKPYDPAA